MSLYNTPQYAALLAFWHEPDFHNSCAHGLSIFMRRNGSKAWCGYVAVPPDHPLYNHEDYMELTLSVHGGITWSADYLPGEHPDGNWYFGFDCAHSGDLSPRDVMFSFSGYPYTLDGVYRDFHYVENECRRLASQLSDLTSEFPETSRD